MKRKDVDVVVVGAGNGGLAAALVCAKAGLDTLVLEKHNLPGGAASSFVRGRFEFECSLHEACEVGEPGARGSWGKFLDAMGVDIDWRYERCTFHCVIPDDGIDVLMPCGRQAFLDEMEHQVPGCRESVEAFFRVAEHAQAGFSYMISHAPKSYFEGTPSYERDKRQHDYELAKLKLVLATRYPDFLRCSAISVKDGMDLLGIPEKAQHILSQYWVYLGASPSNMDFMTNAVMLLAYIDQGTAQPAMKSHEIALAEEKRIRELGGDIWHCCPVRELLMEDGRVAGVRTDEWEIHAKETICNVNPHIVLGSMLDQTKVAPEVRSYYSTKRIALNLYTCYLGLDCTAEELGITGYSSLLNSDPDGDDMAEHAHQLYSNGYTIVNCLNELIPESSPEGTCTLFFTGMTFGDVWKDVAPEDYRRVKERLADEMISQAEEQMHIDIRPHIEEIEMAAAPTFVRYMGTPNGTPYGYQVKLDDGIPMRCMNEGEYHQIPGLHFCGATGILTDGYNCSALSGAKSAQYVVERLRALDGTSSR